MAVTPLHDFDQEMPDPQGHAIGFCNTRTQCDAIVHDLNTAGFPNSSIMVLSGEEGVRLLKRMMGDSLWGEAAEDVMKQGVIEIDNGHLALVIETEDRDEAMLAANIATRHGGHNFNHFGELADERLTK